MAKLSESIVKSLKQVGTLVDKAMDKVEAFGSRLVDKVPVPIQDKVAKYRFPAYGLLLGVAVASIFVAPPLTGKIVFVALNFGLFSSSCKNKSESRAREAAANTIHGTVVAVSVEKTTFKPNAAAPDFKNAVNAEPPEAANSNDALDVKPITLKPPANK